MPPCLWTVIALFLSAATGAAVARAFGRVLPSGRRGSRISPPAVTPGQGTPLPTPLPTLPEGQVEPPSRSRQGGSGREIRLNLPADAGPQVRVTVESLPTRGRSTFLYSGILPVEDPKQASLVRPRGLRGAWAALTATGARWRSGPLRAHGSPEIAIAVAAALLYLITRLWMIDTFPIFFYSDEANNVWFGEQALQHGLLGDDGAWPAVYFPWDANRWTPAISVYLHGVVAALFGKSILVARTVNVLLTLAGTLAVAWILKEHFRSRHWWASILLAIGIPAWFLYSRTVFDTVAATCYYAVFLLTYLHYRFHSARALPLAALAGAMAFYSYSNMQAIMVLLSACLFVSDFRYHAAHRRIWLGTLPLVAILAVPFIQFRSLHPGSFVGNLTAIGSYWVEDLPLLAKLARYAQIYLQGLNPLFWFAPQVGQTSVLPNQNLAGSGHLGILMLPLMSLGLYVSLRNLRSPAHRLVLLSMLVVPVGAALDSIEITRVLAMVVPALILGGLGLEWLAARLPTIPYGVQAVVLAVALAGLGLARMHGALVDGPTSYTDYGLEGAQFGAKAVFQDTLPRLLAEDPKAVIVMTTTWANNTHEYPRFFFSKEDQARVGFGNARDYLVSKLPAGPHVIIGMTPAEYRDAVASPLLARVDVETVIYAPNGDPAFYFARFEYAEYADRYFRQQDLLRLQPVESTVQILGQSASVWHSRLSDSDISRLFDGLKETVVRGDRVNPLRVEVRFPQPIVLREVSLTVGSIQDFTVGLEVSSPSSSEPISLSERFRDLGLDPTVTFQLPAPGVTTSTIALEIFDNTLGPEAQIHVWEITFH
jgi:hypothetical protein